MPMCGSSIASCDLPLRFDTYKGCTHGCTYCFANRRRETIHTVKIGETAESLKRWIKGKRNPRTNWIDWELPIHWGGLSDGFQPIEAEKRVSLEALKVFADTGWPVVISTKGKLIADSEYRVVLRHCNAVVQISMVSEMYDVLEEGAPTFAQRLRMMEKLRPCAKRLIARMQPLWCDREVLEDVCESSIPRLVDAGCSGVTVDGLNMLEGDEELNTKVGQVMTYPYSVARRAYVRIKDAAHGVGMKFYSADERCRSLGDSLNCCGTDGVEGFEANRCNLNHIFFGGYRCSAAQMKAGTAMVFGAIPQNAAADSMCRALSFTQVMDELARTKILQEDYGVAPSASLFRKL